MVVAVGEITMGVLSPFLAGFIISWPYPSNSSIELPRLTKSSPRLSVMPSGYGPS